MLSMKWKTTNAMAAIHTQKKATSSQMLNPTSVELMRDPHHRGHEGATPPDCSLRRARPTTCERIEDGEEGMTRSGDRVPQRSGGAGHGAHQGRHERVVLRPLGRRPSTRPAWARPIGSSTTRRRLATVEIDATFYRLPSETGGPAPGRRRCRMGFTFAVKGTRFITQFRRLRDTVEPVDAFMERLSLLGDKLEVVSWQLPPSLKRDDDLLDGFLEAPGGLARATRRRVPSRVVAVPGDVRGPEASRGRPGPREQRHYAARA